MPEGLEIHIFNTGGNRRTVPTVPREFCGCCGNGMKEATEFYEVQFGTSERPRISYFCPGCRSNETFNCDICSHTWYNNARHWFDSNEDDPVCPTCYRNEMGDGKREVKHVKSWQSQKAEDAKGQRKEIDALIKQGIKRHIQSKARAGFFPNISDDYNCHLLAQACGNLSVSVSLIGLHKDRDQKIVVILPMGFTVNAEVKKFWLKNADVIFGHAYNKLRILATSERKKIDELIILTRYELRKKNSIESTGSLIKELVKSILKGATKCVDSVDTTVSVTGDRQESTSSS